MLSYTWPIRAQHIQNVECQMRIEAYVFYLCSLFPDYEHLDPVFSYYRPVGDCGRSSNRLAVERGKLTDRWDGTYPVRESF